MRPLQARLTYSVLFLIGMLFSLPYSTAQAYSVRDLGALDGDYSQAQAINSSGQVVGDAATSGPGGAFLYGNGKMSSLGTLGGSISLARGINRWGDVVGYSTTSLNRYHAFLWSNGVMSDLGQN